MKKNEVKILKNVIYTFCLLLMSALMGGQWIAPSFPLWLVTGILLGITSTIILAIEIHRGNQEYQKNIRRIKQADDTVVKIEGSLQGKEIFLPVSLYSLNEACGSLKTAIKSPEKVFFSDNFFSSCVVSPLVRLAPFGCLALEHFLKGSELSKKITFVFRDLVEIFVANFLLSATTELLPSRATYLNKLIKSLLLVQNYVEYKQKNGGFDDEEERKELLLMLEGLIVSARKNDTSLVGFKKHINKKNDFIFANIGSKSVKLSASQFSFFREKGEVEIISLLEEERSLLPKEKGGSSAESVGQRRLL